MINRLGAEVATAGVTAALGAVTMAGATEYGVGWASSGPEPGTFPFYIGMIVALASLGTIGQALMRRSDLRDVFLDRAQFKRVISFCLPILGMVIVSLWLGLYVAMALYLVVTSLQGGYRISTAALIAIAAPVSLYIILEKAFQVTPLKGPLESWLGL